MIDIRSPSLDLLDFVPESIAADPEIVALSHAVNPELRSVSQDIIKAIILPRIEELEDPILDVVAWGFRLNELTLWTDATTEGKRRLLVEIFDVLQRSGTTWAVRRILDLLQLTGNLVEWWEEYGGGVAFTYTFRIDASEIGISLATLQQIPELTHRFAPARAHLLGINVTAQGQGLITTVGDALLDAAAVPAAAKVVLNEIAVGDGNGAPIVPHVGMTGLVNEQWRGGVNHIDLYPAIANTVIVEGLIPAGTGGFAIREVGVFRAGDLVAIASLPPIYKPVLADGVSVPEYIRLLLTYDPISAVSLA